jgi:hypothetical protein
MRRNQVAFFSGSFVADSDVRPNANALIRFTLLRCCFLILLLSSAVWAQRAGEIAGGVVDTTGSVLPGVQIDLVNVSTGVRNSTISNDVGLYRFVELVIGNYKIEASKAGFKIR